MQPSETLVLPYLIDGHPKNISVKLFENWSFGLGIDVVLKISILSSGGYLDYRSKTVLAILLGYQLGINSMKSESNGSRV